MTAPSLQGRVDAVVIGTSAGGIDALGRLLPALPARLRIPIAVVIHLPPGRPSLLTTIFEAKSARPVREAQDKESFDAGVVYFAPPDYHLLIDRGPTLALSTDAPVNYSRPSIDVLFESAADQFGERLAAILMTGASHDGTAGLEAVQRAGGITIVQHPADAQVPLMVTAALERVAATSILTLDEIAEMMTTLDVEAGR